VPALLAGDDVIYEPSPAAIVLAVGGTVFVAVVVAVFVHYGVPAIARRSLARAVPDPATPELAARIDGRPLPQRTRTPDRDGDVPRPAELARWADPICVDWDAELRHLTGGSS